MKICVIVAMESEFKLLHKVMESGEMPGVSVHLCGMGKVNAAVTATDIIAAEHPDLVISTGVAGSTSHDARTGDFVVSDEIAYHDAWYGEGNAWGQVQGLPARFKAPGELVSKAERLGAKPGLIVSGDRFIEDSEEVKAILKNFPEALAVDMESGALAQTCYLKNTPFISLRLISDGNDDAHMEAYKNFWQTAGNESFRMVKSFLETL
ncbi:MAG: 5'-methylthioadenosine/S-adenosylhomocysteine nucleosidase [Bacteroidales bacterium]|nr:5'-methylthioadenosine/S-adenosylhomocysteine nucleosidase [Bacteroidales bacterium]